MRALIRMRTLAAACALLLMIAGTAAAGPRVRFDRPGQPDVPDPPMVGEPDTGNNLIIYDRLAQLFLAMQLSNPYLRVFAHPRSISMTRAMHPRASAARR